VGGTGKKKGGEECGKSGRFIGGYVCMKGRGIKARIRDRRIGGASGIGVPETSGT